MKTWQITIEGGETYTAIGERDALMDAAYDDGALGVAITEWRPA